MMRRAPAKIRKAADFWVLITLALALLSIPAYLGTGHFGFLQAGAVIALIGPPPRVYLWWIDTKARSALERQEKARRLGVDANAPRVDETPMVEPMDWSRFRRRKS